ncbi:MAG: heavy metal translocating P-type ATPase [Candidatus Avigastranaerophilus sp.]
MCEHNLNHKHSHRHEHNEEEKNNLNRVYISAVILIAAILYSNNELLKLSLFTAAYLIAGYDVIFSAVKNILCGKVFDENFLMSIATIGAFGLKEYPEAVSVMLLYQAGEYFQHKAVDKSRESVSKLMDIRAEYANIEYDGEIKQVKPETVDINDVIIVKAGERVPLDGIIIDGHSFLDTSSLTGESVLREVSINDEILSGAVNTNGVLKIKVNKKYQDSTVSKILEMVENASSRKSRAENFITKFARYYTPIVVICALMIILIPLCLNGSSNITTWTERALTFLVISCPCALVISVPLTFFGGIGGASRKGILIKGSNYLEMLSEPEIIAFDKTGTLTKGTFNVTALNPAKDIDKNELLESAAYAENYSNHPIAVSIKNAYGKTIDISIINNSQEIAGKGIKAVINNDIILAGNRALMSENAINFIDAKQQGTIIYISKNNRFLGSIVISDEIKENAQSAIDKIKALDIKTVILTGDTKQNTEIIANKLKSDNYYADLLPSEKVEKLEILLKNKNPKKSVIFAGDGINDAPVLMRSDIGIAMGVLGSDAAIEAADVVITDDNPEKISLAVQIARKTMLIVKQNIAFAIGVKVLFLVLGTFGLMSMWGAVFADVGVTLLAVLNSLRTLK